jgi:hypothetical protein
MERSKHLTLEARVWPIPTPEILPRTRPAEPEIKDPLKFLGPVIEIFDSKSEDFDIPTSGNGRSNKVLSIPPLSETDLVNFDRHLKAPYFLLVVQNRETKRHFVEVCGFTFSHNT